MAACGAGKIDSPAGNANSGPRGDTVKERSPLNNNNRGNNRRRGRGNNRQQGGGQQLNRIDSRARGNAPQLLEKYRKLAHDAHLNGDRVTAEYYLQFADHYFRVLADARVRPEDPRARRDERWEGGNDEQEDSGEFSGEGDFPSYEQPGYNRRDDRPRDDRPRDDRPREVRAREDRPREDRARDDRQHEERETRVSEIEEPASSPDSAAPAGERTEFEPPENPFVRDSRPTRGLRPRREDRRPRGRDEDAPATFDVAILQPSIAAREDAAEAVDQAPEEAAPKRRGRKPKVAAAEIVDEG